jgi:hypothetical protein
MEPVAVEVVAGVVAGLILALLGALGALVRIRLQPNHVLHLGRLHVPWEKYNDSVKSRYWVCGASLEPVAQNRLIETFVRKGVSDIKVLLPNTDKRFVSYDQLEKFNQQSPELAPQVNLAINSYKTMLDCVAVSYKGKSDDLVRTYGGVIYSNITIYDDDAFITFYDCTGKGDRGFTLQFKKNVNKKGFEFVEQEFLRMWTAPESFGEKST